MAMLLKTPLLATGDNDSKVKKQTNYTEQTSIIVCLALFVRELNGIFRSIVKTQLFDGT